MAILRPLRLRKFKPLTAELACRTKEDVLNHKLAITGTGHQLSFVWEMLEKHREEKEKVYAFGQSLQ